MIDGDTMTENSSPVQVPVYRGKLKALSVYTYTDGNAQSNFSGPLWKYSIGTHIAHRLYLMGTRNLGHFISLFLLTVNVWRYRVCSLKAMEQKKLVQNFRAWMIDTDGKWCR